MVARQPSIDGILVAQITDLHIGFDPGNLHEHNVRRLKLAIDHLSEMDPRPSMLIGSVAAFLALAASDDG